jgi:methionyl-tRNA formyltransferase
MRLVFVATGEIALPSFRHLLLHGPRPLALVTQPDKPAGRHMVPAPPAIKIEAAAAGIPVMQPALIGDSTAELAALAPEVIVVMAYGQILRENILRLPSLAIINLHASLLPRHRGAACIQAAIDAGDPESGISSLHVVRELDAGDVILTKAIDIAYDETGGSLHDRLALLAPAVLAETLDRLAAGTAPRIPQDPALVTYVPKLLREDGRIDWQQPATAIERRIRAYDPWPGTYTMTEEAGGLKRLKLLPHTRVLESGPPPGTLSTHDGRLVAGCGTGALEIRCVQPEGGRRMSAADYLRGREPRKFC